MIYELSLAQENFNAYNLRLWFNNFKLKFYLIILKSKIHQ